MSTRRTPGRAARGTGMVGTAATVLAMATAPVVPEIPVAAPDPATVTCGLGTFRAGAWPTDCWRPYADTSPFNRRLAGPPPVAGRSAPIVDHILSMGPVAGMVAGVADTAEDWYHPLYWSGPDDPLYTIHCTESWGRCAVEGRQVRIPARARPAGGSDGHLAVVDQASGWEYDLWQVQDKPAGGGVLTASWGGRTRIAGAGLGAGATSANFGLAAGVIRAAELEAGHIDHALSILVRCTADAFVPPADQPAYVCADQSDAPANGQHLWLDMTAAEIADLDVPAWKKTALRALSEYGAFVGDTGHSVGIAFHIESGSSYTSFGAPDPMVELARRSDGVIEDEGTWTFEMASGVDWAGRLRVLDPCVASGSCAFCATG